MKAKMAVTCVSLLASGALFLAACAPRVQEKPGDNGGGEQQLLQTTPAPVGEVDKIHWNSTYGELSSLDPIKRFNYPENTIIANFCEGLYQVQPDFSVVPNLATSVSSDDGKTWVIELRDDVKFWDGKPMTSADAVFSLNRHTDPKEGSVWAGSVAANFSSVVATKPHEVTVTMKVPDYTLPSWLGTVMGVVVQEEHRKASGENYGNPETGVMCTGPFQFKPGNWKQGQSITLDRNESYWNPAKKAHAKRIEIGFVVDPSAILTGLSTGEIQGTYDVPLPALSTLEKSTSGTLYAGQGQQEMAIISTGQGIFAEPAVRRAITKATNRQAIADSVYEGTAGVARSIVSQAAWDALPGTAELRDAKLPDLSFDLEAAKAELAGVRLDLTQPVKIAYPSERSFYADIINEMANGAKAIGITLEPSGVPSAQFGRFFADAEARKGFDGFVTTNFLGSPDPLLHLTTVAKTGSDQNFSKFSDPKIDAALDAASREPDQRKRAELTVEAEALIMASQPWVPVSELAVRLYMNQSITGAPASSIYLYYPWAADIGAAA